MKKIIFISGVILPILMLSRCIGAPTLDPVKEYIESEQPARGSIIYEWEVDLNHNGKKDVLLCDKYTSDDIEEYESDTKSTYDPNIKVFTVYLANAHGPGYFESKGMDINGSVGLGVGLSVDTTRCYVGWITQIKKWGLVCITKTGHPRNGPATVVIYAYTVEDDHLKETKLSQYNPEKQKSPIYDQYLKEGKRTKIQLQEITIGK